MDISKYKIFKQSGSPTYVEAKGFINDIKEFLLNKEIQIHNDITKFKTYYCSNLSIPKDRIKNIEKKYNIKKVLDPAKADIIFVDSYNFKTELLESSIIDQYYLIAYNNTTNTILNNKHHYIKQYLNYISFNNLSKIIDLEKSLEYEHSKSSFKNPEWFKDLELDESNISYTVVFSYKYVEKIVKLLKPFFINPNILPINDYVEEDLEILTKIDFYNNFYNRLNSEANIYITLLNIYSKYNIISFKLLLKSIFSRGTGPYLISLKDRMFLYNLYNIKNKDVYTKYALKEFNNNGSMLKIYTSNKNIIDLYKFLFLRLKYNLNSDKKDISQYFLQCSSNLKTFHMSDKHDNIVPYFIVSDKESIKNLESDLINFKILPEKEKDVLINKLLDFIENLSTVNLITK